MALDPETAKVLSGLAHDLNNPLTAVLSGLRILVADLAKPVSEETRLELAEVAGEVQQAAERLKEIARRVSELARK